MLGKVIRAVLKQHLRGGALNDKLSYGEAMDLQVQHSMNIAKQNATGVKNKTIKISEFHLYHSILFLQMQTIL